MKLVLARVLLSRVPTLSVRACVLFACPPRAWVEYFMTITSTTTVQYFIIMVIVQDSNAEGCNDTIFE